jgi:NADPH2:quinone reductase
VLIVLFPPSEAATIPLAAMTSAVGLYQRLGLPLPWHPATSPIPLIIYGAASAVGSYAIQLAQLSNIHPLICVAGRGIKHVEGLIDKSKGDMIVDYRSGDESVVGGLREAAKHAGKLEYAFDAVSEKGSYINICEVLDRQTGQITLVLPGKDYAEIPSTIRKSWTKCGMVFQAMDDDPWEKKAGTKTGNKEFGYVMFRLFGRGLARGWFKGQPYEVVPGGLNGVEGALTKLKEGKASAVKYVFRIADTPNL